MYTVYMYHFIQLPSWTQVDTNMISILRKKERIVRCMKRVTWKHTFSSVQLSRSVVSKSLRPHGLQHARLQSFTVSCSLLKLMSIESVIPSNHLILCRPLLLLPSISPSIRVFSNESALQIRWPKYWNFSFSISPSNEYSGLISFRIDWFDLLALQSTLNFLMGAT